MDSAIIPKEIRVPPNGEGQRLDRFLAEVTSALSRTRVQQLIGDERVRVNNEVVRASHRLKSEDRVTLALPPLQPDSSIDPEEIPLEIFFEDRHLLVLSKPAGMIVHPAGAVREGTLVNALLAHCRDLSGINGVLRPGIVHRLDKDTSGLLMVAKDDRTHRGLAEQLEARTVERRYRAILWGRMEGEGRIDAPLRRDHRDRKKMAVAGGQAGRAAATRYAVVRSYDYLTAVELRLETGRTHQIRVHMEHIGRPVFADSVYGGGPKWIRGISPDYRVRARALLEVAGRQMLHAKTLAFTHPITGEAMRYEADLPGDMAAVLEALRKERE